MSRKSARENAFRAVYEFLETGERNDITVQLLCAGGDDADGAFTREVYGAVIDEFAFLKEVISSYADEFAFERIYKVDLAALLIAAYEILLRDDIPEKVSVNEALELCRTYSTEKSTAFVNGVLASVIRNKEEWKNAREDH